jgi:hypothetical protein
MGPPLYVEPFIDETDSAGLDGVTARYIAWGDYDGDGLEDLVLDGQRLFLNVGGLSFTETTLAAGIDPDGGGAGAAWADIDNDGYLDLFCSGYEDTTGDSLDRLYLNNGDGTFADITVSAGVDDLFDSRACAWGDFDGDGDIDLYVVNYEDPPGSGTGAPDRLYINNGNNTFTDTSVSSGIAATTPCIGCAVACCDYDGDGDLDIYVANDKLDRNFLWQNNGSGVFTNEAAAAFVEGKNEGAGFFGSSTGASWGDYDNDQDFDLLVTNQKTTLPQPYEDDTNIYMKIGGVNTFADVYPDSWVAADPKALCPAWFDYNNDTQLDFYLCSENAYGALFNGHTTGAFINIAPYANLWVSKPLGCAIADYNSDGMPDIFICAADRVYLFKNNHTRYNYLKVKLSGTACNHAGIGSIVSVTCPCTTPDTITRQVGGANGTGCQDSLIALFGMGNHDGPYTVDIIWSQSGGATSQNTGMAINQLHPITQP